MKNLTTKEIIEKGKAYDEYQNEGGEGYNPYWDEMRRRESEEAQKKATQPKSKKEQIKDLYRRVEIECGSIAREIDEEKVDKKRTEIYAEIDRLNKEIEAEYKIEWTEEVTKSRRVEWNGYIRGLMNSNGQIDVVDQPKIYQRQKDQGWTVDDLKKAIKIHGM